MGRESNFSNVKHVFKGELQRQNKLISSERPFKILISRSLKSAKPFSRYSTLKIEIWPVFREKNDRKTENVVF